MSWVMRRVLVLRQTCRYARETVSPFPSIVHTKDGRWVMANLGTRPGDVARLIDLLKRYGAALQWLTEVTGTKIGRWPIAEVAVKMSESPAYIGGRLDRGAPCYGEDNHYVYGELLGMSAQEIEALVEEGVI